MTACTTSSTTTSNQSKIYANIDFDKEEDDNEDQEDRDSPTDHHDDTKHNREGPSNGWIATTLCNMGMVDNQVMPEGDKKYYLTTEEVYDKDVAQ